MGIDSRNELTGAHGLESLRFLHEAVEVAHLVHSCPRPAVFLDALLNLLAYGVDALGLRQ